MSHRDKQFCALRVQQASESKKAAADVFRRKWLDMALKRLLKHAQPTSPAP